MKQKVLIDVTVTVELPRHVTRWCRTMEDRAKELTVWAAEFEAFVRDHRSQDPVSLTVDRHYQDQCTHCGREWEEDSDGPLCCAKAQEEWSLERNAV